MAYALYRNEQSYRRIVEFMLGERMPHRPLYSGRMQPWLERIKAMFTDVLLLFATLHLARFIGRIHGRIAKQLLVSSQAY